MIIIGIVSIEIIVLNETILTERVVSAPYLDENMVVMAAVGAEAEMVMATKTSPLIPQRYIPSKVRRGNMISLSPIEKILLKLLIADKSLLLAK